MAESNYHQAGLQHLAFRNQSQRPLPTAGDHNPWAAEAQLEAHLQQRALLEVQHLELQRLQPQLTLPSVLEAKKHHPEWKNGPNVDIIK